MVSIDLYRDICPHRGEMRIISFKTAKLSLAVLAGMAVFGCIGAGRPVGQEMALESLEGQLYSADSTVAEQAALSLLSSRSEEAFRTLRRTLESGSSGTARAAVLFAFISHEDQRIATEAADALGDPSPRTVELAKRYLIEVIGDRMAQELLSRARDDSRPPSERIAAIEAVGQYGRKETVDDLLDLLEDPSGEVVDAVAAALSAVTYQPFGSDAELWRSWYKNYGRLTPDQWRESGQIYYRRTDELKSRIAKLESYNEMLSGQVVELSKKIIDSEAILKRHQEIVRILEGAGPTEARIYAARKLKGLSVPPEVVALLVELASSDQAPLAAAVIETLGELGAREAMDVVAFRLGDDDDEVRLKAVEAYGRLPDSDRNLLLRLIDDSSYKVRAAVAEAAGSRQWQSAFDRLVALLEDNYPEVRSAAARALGRLQDARAVPALVKLVDDEEDKVAYEAVNSLSLMPDPSAYDHLIRAVEHGNPQVREVAVVALEAVLKLEDLEDVDRTRGSERLFHLSMSDPEERVANRAWDAWEALLPRMGFEPKFILEQAEDLMDAGRDNRARALLTTLAESDRNGEVALHARRMLAEGYIEKEEFKAALGHFRKILEVKPKDTEARRGERLAMEGLGDDKGLAQLDAQDIAQGAGTPRTKRKFVESTEALLQAGEYGLVVDLADQIGRAKVSLEDDFKKSIAALRARALPSHLDKLIVKLAVDDEGGRASAIDALAALGRDAAGVLVVALESPTAPVREAAVGLLSSLSEGDDFGFKAEIDPSEQTQALEKWRAWLAGVSSNSATRGS